MNLHIKKIMSTIAHIEKNCLHVYDVKFGDVIEGVVLNVVAGKIWNSIILYLYREVEVIRPEISIYYAKSVTG